MYEIVIAILMNKVTDWLACHDFFALPKINTYKQPWNDTFTPGSKGSTTHTHTRSNASRETFQRNHTIASPVWREEGGRTRSEDETQTSSRYGSAYSIHLGMHIQRTCSMDVGGRVHWIHWQWTVSPLIQLHSMVWPKHLYRCRYVYLDAVMPNSSSSTPLHR